MCIRNYSWLCVALATLLGCSQAASPPTARIEGRVTYEGEPVTVGGISFSPLSRGKAAWAELVDGHYVVEAVPLGRVRVQIQSVRETGNQTIEFGKPHPQFVSIVPDKYRRGIEMDVIEDKTDLNFNLSE